MKFIIGTKEGMTQVFDENGVCKAATILKIKQTQVSQIKRVDSDGYDAVQVATGEQKEHRVAKAQKGHYGAGVLHSKEYRPKVNEENDVASIEKGSTFDASIFNSGDLIAVRSVSKGKGFQGVVKRHGFAGGRRSHGQKHSEREPGAIGATGNKVLKGTRMAGRMGGDTLTIKNLRVLQVNPSENILLVSGAVPGRKGTLVEVRGI